MILGTVYKEGHSNNSLFKKVDVTHKYNPLGADIYMRDLFLDSGICINTQDLNKDKSIAFKLFFEVHDLQKITSNQPNYLIALECPTINPNNRNHALISKFDRVFSWDKEGLGWHHGYEQIFFPSSLEHDVFFKSYKDRDGFLCLINANKSFKNNVNGDLYRERYSFIKWIERAFPDAFNLYGIGWNKPYVETGFKGKLKRNILRLATKAIGYRPFPSYQGEVKSKNTVYENHKFSICYENMDGYEYYITEKIIDSLMAGCVPIYWGASKIAEFIPDDCFIDRKSFSSNDELISYLISINENEYARYQENIMHFLNHQANDYFSYQNTFGLVVERVAADLRYHDQS